jgi:GNAT superfamily N-acetyltransferase
LDFAFEVTGLKFYPFGISKKDSILSEFNNFTISTDQTRFDLELIHSVLTKLSWAEGVTLEVVKRAMQHSFAFGAFDGTAQIGYARVVTDFTRTAWLADVFILESHRGKGLGKWFVQTMLEHPRLQTVKWLLTTDDAHELYRQFGFSEIEAKKFMIRAPNKHFNEAVK